MAKNRRRFQLNQKKSTPVTDRTLWFSDLSSLDPKNKNEVWAAQALFFMKRNARIFLDPKKAKLYRDTDSLVINTQAQKEMVDPKTPQGGGGTASYFASDWKANPIYLHLKNIVKADIENSGKQLEVNMTDKFAKTRQMEDNYKILYQQAFRKVINYMAEQIGLPGISETQDPYKWADNLLKSKDDETQTPDMVNKYLDLIKNQITDSQDLALYNELIYKGDYEMAFELGINYYIFNLNQWHDRWADEFINDIMHFNKGAGEFTTDLFTGRPVIGRFIPETLYTSPFRRKDGEDIQYYFTEYMISFGDFMKTMGKNLSAEKLKEVFMLMKQQGVHNIDWRNEFFSPGENFARDNAMVKIGKAAFLSTDMEVEMEDSSFGIPMRRPVEISWQPMDENQKRVEKRYNVWRWWYYIPPVVSEFNNANWAWQSQYIFELQKFQDQQRYGDNGRYAKPPLVIYDNSSQASYTDIVEAFMPKIHHLWGKYQNFLVNDIDASILSEDFIGGLLSAVDEDNNIRGAGPDTPSGGGVNPYQEQWRMIKQGGTGFLKMRDNNGNAIVDPQKLVINIKNNYLEKAESCLVQMLSLYEYMVKALAFSPMTAGEEVKPRTPVAALEQTLKASAKSKFFIQKGYEDLLKGFGERNIWYIIDIAREVDVFKFPDRWEDFMQNVGYANGLAIQGMKDIDPETVGMTINYVDNQAKKDFIMQLAMEYVKTKELDESFIFMLMGVDNWKYSFVLMRMAIKKRKQELQEEAAIQHQREMEKKQGDLQIAMMLDKNKAAGKDQNIVTQGEIDIMVQEALNNGKYMAQSKLKRETDELRKSENQQKADLKKDQETHVNNLEAQKAI